MAAGSTADLLSSPQLEGQQRVALLKALESVTADAFHASLGAEPSTVAAIAALGGGPAAEQRLLKAALHQQLTGIPEYSPAFYAVLDACAHRQQLQREAVIAALSSLPQHGFDQLDRTLIVHAALVSGAYVAFHRKWLRAVQGNPLAAELAAADAAGQLPRELYNHYTIIIKNADGSYGHVPYASYFPEEVAAIVEELDDWITALLMCHCNLYAVLTDVGTEHVDVKQQYIAYLQQYRTCLAETGVARLEERWAKLDRLWMAIRHPVQVVHDIEYGYVDPLRCKVQPEFSLRILDDSFAKHNRTIAAIQDVMVAYFQRRPGRLAQDGLAGLRASLAGIYHVPFITGVSMHFRFAGQSIPNRSEVRRDHGVKIFFDMASAAARADAAKELALQVVADPSRAEAINAKDSIVYLVAPHEIGHAIYSLDNLREVITPATKTLLEEPRAELTTLHTLRLMLEDGHLAREQVECLLCCFLLEDLRRFQSWDSSATRPYTVSAMACWARAEAVGYVTLNEHGMVVMHDSKVAAFLEQSSQLFERILDAEDALDGAAVEGILAEMEACSGSGIVQHLVRQLHTAQQAQHAQQAQRRQDAEPPQSSS